MQQNKSTTYAKPISYSNFCFKELYTEFFYYIWNTVGWYGIYLTKSKDFLGYRTYGIYRILSCKSVIRVEAKELSFFPVSPAIFLREEISCCAYEEKTRMRIPSNVNIKNLNIISLFDRKNKNNKVIKYRKCKAYLERESIDEVTSSKINGGIILSVTKKISTGDGSWTLRVRRWALSSTKNIVFLFHFI